MTEFAVGDLVEAVKGEDLHRGRVGDRSVDSLSLGETGHRINYYEREGFTLTVIEKALPPLPTADGYYEAERFPIAKGYNAFRLHEGDWTEEGIEQDAEAMASALPLHRLAPVAATVAEVLTEFAKIAHWDKGAASLQATAAHFGVEL